jgi:kynurenine 3-monooxygenase
MTQSITIVGAGLVGSLLAGYLARRGYDINVYERRPDPRLRTAEGGRSINLALSHRGWRALRRLGIAEAIADIAMPMYGRQIHELEADDHFSPYGKEGQAIYSVSRAELNRRLLDFADASANVRFYFGMQCLEPDLDQGRLFFQAQGDVVPVESERVLATDGAFSAIRLAMMKQPRFSYSQEYLDHGYKELDMPPAPDGQHAMRPDALHIWPRGEFMLIALPNPDGSFTCTLFLPFEGENSFEALRDEADLRGFFEAYFPDVPALIPRYAEEFFHNPTATLLTIRSRPWHHGDRFLLLGDAAHAIVPFYGQGMNAGFEDIETLDRLIEREQGDWARIMPAFFRERKPAADAIADLALRNFIEMRDWVADPVFLRKQALSRRLSSTLLPQQWLDLYGMVTFSDHSYDYALRVGELQDRILEEIAQHEDLDFLLSLKDDRLLEKLRPYLAEHCALPVDV